MHKCYPGKCKFGFHYSNSRPESLEDQQRMYAERLQGEAEKFFEAGLPRPDRYEILDFIEIGDYLGLKIRYANCTNFDGLKILVFRATVKDLVRAKHIDPHFADYAIPESHLKTLVARFQPDDSGWLHAITFMKMFLK